MIQITSPFLTIALTACLLAKGDSPIKRPNKSATASWDQSHLEPLFKADLQYRSESQADAVVTAEGREGAYIGSGDGTARQAIGFAGRFAGRSGPATASIR